MSLLPALCLIAILPTAGDARGSAPGVQPKLIPPVRNLDNPLRVQHPGDPIVMPQGPPLSVVAVVREGLPPYEDANRRYMLQGYGWERLKPGMVVKLARPGVSLSPSELIVLTTQTGYALAKIYRDGATFPMRGDLALLPEKLRSLPALPAGAPSLPSPSAPTVLAQAPPALAAAPPVPAAPAPPPPPGADHQEPIFFLPQGVALTPGAKDKLKAWVAAWGSTGRWVLALPLGQGSGLTEARLETLREELVRLGVPKVETDATAQQVQGKYPAIFVVHRPAP